MRTAPTKVELLEHYIKKDPTRFVQLDGFHLGKDVHDDVMRPDEDGDSLWGRETHELMSGADVRVLIRPGLHKAVARRLLKKIRQWLKRPPDSLAEFIRDPERETAANQRPPDPFQ